MCITTAGVFYNSAIEFNFDFINDIVTAENLTDNSAIEVASFIWMFSCSYSCSYSSVYIKWDTIILFYLLE